MIRNARFIYPHNDRHTECRLDVVELDYYTFVVFTERKGNQNVSITNSIESAATTFLQETGIDPQGVCFMERYEDHPEYLDEAHFAAYNSEYRTLRNPSWTRVDATKAEAILGAIDSPNQQGDAR